MGGAQIRDHANTAHNLLEVCALLRRFPYAIFYYHVMAGCSSPKPPLCCTAADYAQCPGPYVHHVLLVSPALHEGALNGTSASMSKPFPLVNEPDTLNRDRIVVPAGWDSLGKIAVLRDGFDANAWDEAKERDLFSDTRINMSDDETGAQKLYAPLLQDRGLNVRVLLSLIVFWFFCLIRGYAVDPAQDRSNFLAESYDEISRRADRGIFPTTTSAFAPTAAGLVGPLGSSSFSPEMAELAFVEMEGSDTCATLGGLSLGGRAGAATFPILGSVPSLM